MRSTIREDTALRHIGKYANRNPVHQFVLGRFLDTVANWLAPFQSGSCLDFGCGEALFWQEMAEREIKFSRLVGVDLREDALSAAREFLPDYEFRRQDLLTWAPAEKFDLIIASQVLEHLPRPDLYLQKLLSLVSKEGRLLLTVPWEPFFRLSNLARGRDILRLGNHPEHVNLWGRNEFVNFVSQHAVVAEVGSIFPFTLVMAKQKD